VLCAVSKSRTGVSPDQAPGRCCRTDTRDACPTLELIESRMQRLFGRERIGAVLVEPVQVRGGINIPPPGFLPMLRRLCDEHDALLILDEIYTALVARADGLPANTPGRCRT